MTIIRCTAVLLMLACLLGCTPATGLGPMPDPTIPELYPDEIPETSEEAWTMSAELMAMIKEATGCNDSRAKAILEVFQLIQMDLPVSASRISEEGNSILVKTQDGKTYEVGIDRKYFVYSVKDLERDKYVYVVYE